MASPHTQTDAGEMRKTGQVEQLGLSEELMVLGGGGGGGRFKRVAHVKLLCSSAYLAATLLTD